MHAKLSCGRFVCVRACVCVYVCVFALLLLLSERGEYYACYILLPTLSALSLSGYPAFVYACVTAVLLRTTWQQICMLHTYMQCVCVCVGSAHTVRVCLCECVSVYEHFTVNPFKRACSS